VVNVALITLVIPWSDRVELKPLYMCLGCSNHTYNNNMIQMQCSIKHSKYLSVGLENVYTNAVELNVA
jgi:hypothetical protein